MSCRELEKYDRGELDRAAFERHAAGCPGCRKALGLDDEVLSQAVFLRRRVEAPFLWERIERGVRTRSEEDGRDEAETRAVPRRTSRAARLVGKLLRPVPAAAALLGIGTVAAAGYFALQARTPSSGLLADKALARVEKKEAGYEKAIEGLAAQARPLMAALDIEMMFLYRERLEAIDAQIERCRSMLERNPANAHIRRYFLGALQDKKATLAAVLDMKETHDRRS